MAAGLPVIAAAGLYFIESNTAIGDHSGIVGAGGIGTATAEQIRGLE